MRGIVAALAALALAPSLRSEFLFDPANPTPNGFFTPTLDYENSTYEYSAWDIFYAPHTAGNFPDVFAPYGGKEIAPGLWAPESRAEAGFPSSPFYNPSNPLAFWDARNPTITQQATSAFIIGPDISGNIYTFSEKTSYVLANDPDYGELGTVVLQFQTDGSPVDFSSIKLVYSDGFNTYEIAASEAEYLREYHVTGGSHWSAAGGYASRVAVQWDMSGIVDPLGNPITSYEIHWSASTTSMSLQKVDLVTSESYQAGIPISAVWTGGDGSWSDDGNWSLHGNSGLTSPQQNGNIRFQNAGGVAVALDEDFTLGELIFEGGGDVVIDPLGAGKLAANTGITTREAATGVYTINADYEFGALNFFEINAGTVVINGVVSGDFGMVKTGSGALVLANDNTFTGFLGVQGGTVRIEGVNSYTGNTTVVNGRIVVAGDAGAAGALGNSTSVIGVGGDESLYHYAAGEAEWLAELVIDGNHAISRDIQLAPGDFEKRLGAFHASGEAEFSGAIRFTGASADPDNPDSAAGKVFLTAQAAEDRLVFSGSMTGGAAAKTVTLDGQGTIVYRGPAKTYANSTVVGSGTLVLEAGSGYAGNGDVTVFAGATLRADGTLAGAGSLLLDGGRLEGSGTISRSLTVDQGDVIAPGNGVGVLETASQVWGAGGIYEWEVGGFGTGADLLGIAGTLTISASSATPFEIRILSLDALGFAGPLEGFDPALDETWVIATASGGIEGFNGAYFFLDTTGFAHAFTGTFGLAVAGSDLLLTYTAVPEPSSLVLFAAGVLAAFARRRRRAAIPPHHP